MEWALTAWSGLLLHGVGSYYMEWAFTAWSGLLLHGVGFYCMVWALTTWSGLLLHGVGSYYMEWALTAWCGLLLHVHCPDTEPYVRASLPVGVRRVVAGLRAGCLPLQVELGRYTSPKTPLSRHTYLQTVIMVSRIRNTSCYVPV